MGRKRLRIAGLFNRTPKHLTATFGYDPAAARKTDGRTFTTHRRIRLPSSRARMAEAEWIYTLILASAPDHFDALHLRGLIHHQRGDHVGALAHIDAVLRRISDSILGFEQSRLGAQLTWAV
jgi:hypothetical protein